MANGSSPNPSPSSNDQPLFSDEEIQAADQGTAKPSQPVDAQIPLAQQPQAGPGRSPEAPLFSDEEIRAADEGTPMPGTPPPDTSRDVPEKWTTGGVFGKVAGALSKATGGLDPFPPPGERSPGQLAKSAGEGIAVGAGIGGAAAAVDPLYELAVSKLAGDVLPGMEEMAARQKLAEYAPKVLRAVKDLGIGTGGAALIWKAISSALSDKK